MVLNQSGDTRHARELLAEQEFSPASRALHRARQECSSREAKNTVLLVVGRLPRKEEVGRNVPNPPQLLGPYRPPNCRHIGFCVITISVAYPLSPLPGFSPNINININNHHHGPPLLDPASQQDPMARPARLRRLHRSNFGIFRLPTPSDRLSAPM